MAVTATPIFPQAVKNYTQTLVNADGTTVKAVAAAGTNGTKIESIIVTSTDTSARDLAIYITISATNYLIGTVAIPLSSGFTNAVVSVDLLRSAQIPGLAYDANGNRYLYLASGSTLSVGVLVAVTAAKTVTVFAQGADF